MNGKILGLVSALALGACAKDSRDIDLEKEKKLAGMVVEHPDTKVDGKIYNLNIGDYEVKFFDADENGVYSNPRSLKYATGHVVRDQLWVCIEGSDPFCNVQSNPIDLDYNMRRNAMLSVLRE